MEALGTNRLCLFQGVICEFVWRNWRKRRRFQTWIRGLPISIRTGYLQFYLAPTRLRARELHYFFTSSILIFHRFIKVIVQDSSVGRRATDWTAGLLLPAGARDFPLLHKAHTRSGAHPASSPKGAIGSFPVFFFFVLFLCVGWDWVHLCGTSAAVGLLYQLRMIDDDDYGAVGGMMIGRGNLSTRRKPAPVPLCPP
jgi:hypothetical protein